jgi:hypothetical protein
MFIATSALLFIVSQFMGATEEHIALLTELAVARVRPLAINISPLCG